MLSLAESQNWEQLAQDSVVRHQKIERLFVSDNHLNTQQLTNLDQQVKSVDNAITSLIGKFKKEAIKNSLNLRNTQSALKAYNSHQS